MVTAPVHSRYEAGRWGYQLLVLDGHGGHVSIEFLWLCEQNLVKLVFLPAYSYILQPLNLSCFLLIKSKYRQLIADLSALNDPVPVKKHRFITCYYLAGEEELTERVV